MLVSLYETKKHLRMDDIDDEDDDLALKIQAAGEMVLDYIGRDQPFLDSSGEPDIDGSGNPINIPFRVKAAVLLMVGYLSKYRDGDPDNQFDYGYLPKPVTSLLYSMRRPVAL